MSSTFYSVRFLWFPSHFQPPPNAIRCSLSQMASEMCRRLAIFARRFTSQTSNSAQRRVMSIMYAFCNALHLEAICNGYEPHVYWWEIVECFRKLFLTHDECTSVEYTTAHFILCGSLGTWCVSLTHKANTSNVITDKHALTYHDPALDFLCCLALCSSKILQQRSSPIIVVSKTYLWEVAHKTFDTSATKCKNAKLMRIGVLRYTFFQHVGVGGWG